MPLDPESLPAFRAVQTLLGVNGLFRMLEGLVDRSSSAQELARNIERAPLSNGEKALLRTAMWLYNGTGTLRVQDLATLDLENRTKFVRALATLLGVEKNP